MKQLSCSLCGNKTEEPQLSHPSVCQICSYPNWYELFDYPRDPWTNINMEMQEAKGRLEILVKELAIFDQNGTDDDELANLAGEIQDETEKLTSLQKRKQDLKQKLLELGQNEEEISYQFESVKFEIRLSDFLVSPYLHEGPPPFGILWDYNPRTDLLRLSYNVQNPAIFDQVNPRNILLVLSSMRSGAKKVINTKHGDYFAKLIDFLDDGAKELTYRCHLKPILRNWEIPPGNYQMTLTFHHRKYNPLIRNHKGGFPIIRVN